jgi:predicted metal-dependent peptidase
VAIDTSGSISDLLLSRELAVVEAIESARYTVHRYAFASTCAAWTGKTLPNVGHGTQLAPVIAATRQHPILLLLSDGYMDPIRQSDQLHIWVGGRSIERQHGRHIIIPEMDAF